MWSHEHFLQIIKQLLEVYKKQQVTQYPVYVEFPEGTIQQTRT